MTTDVLIFAGFGDSLWQGLDAFPLAAGGGGTFPELAAAELCSLTGRELAGPGLRGFWRDLAGHTDGEWTHTGTWTINLDSDAFNKAPYGRGFTGTTITDTSTFNAIHHTQPIVDGCVWWIDPAVVGAGRPQYNLDGAGWVQFPDAPVGDNSLNKWRLNAPVNTSISFRCFDGSGNVVAMPSVGFEPFYINPDNWPGRRLLIYHNFAVGGARLHQMVGAAGGDPMACVRAVKLGSGNPPQTYPNAGATVQQINDDLYVGALGQAPALAQWNTDLVAWNTIMALLGPTMFLSPWECLPATYATADQTAFRAQTKSTAAALSLPPVLDNYDAYAAVGITGNAAMTANGLLADGTHPAQLCHLQMVPRLFGLLQRYALAGLSTPPTYPERATSAAIAAQAGSPAIAAKASVPIALPPTIG